MFSFAVANTVAKYKSERPALKVSRDRMKMNSNVVPQFQHRKGKKNSESVTHNDSF